MILSRVFIDFFSSLSSTRTDNFDFLFGLEEADFEVCLPFFEVNGRHSHEIDPFENITYIIYNKLNSNLNDY